MVWTQSRFHQGCAGLIVLLAVVTSVVPLAVSILLRDAQWNLILPGIWTVITGWGVIATCWTWYDSWLELRASDSADTALRLIASANVRRETLRALVLIGLFYIGLTVFVGISDMTVNRLLLIAIAISLVVNSFFDRLERRETASVLRAAIERERSAAAAVGDSLEGATHDAEKLC